MKPTATPRIVVFVEGETEVLFVREFMLKVFDYTASVLCFRLPAGNTEPFGSPHTAPDPFLQVEVYGVGNDEKVLAVIRDREEKLFQTGVVAIFGLRDMYSEEYLKRAASKKDIDAAVVAKFQENFRVAVQTMSKPDCIKFHCAIMEIEAWLLAMPQCFERFDARLTTAHIETELQKVLLAASSSSKTKKSSPPAPVAIIDPETAFVKPTNVLETIFKSAGLKYTKGIEDNDKLMRQIKKSDFDALARSGNCDTYCAWYNDVMLYRSP